MTPELTYTQETVIGVWQDGKLVAIERKNGHLERYMVTEANGFCYLLLSSLRPSLRMWSSNWADTTALYGVDTPQKL